jgi:hypothetical protein
VIVGYSAFQMPDLQLWPSVFPQPGANHEHRASQHSYRRARRTRIDFGRIDVEAGVCELSADCRSD